MVIIIDTVLAEIIRAFIIVLYILYDYCYRHGENQQTFPKFV